jgi:hypothetical protein
MNQILLCNGGNDYKLPHDGKLKIAAANGRDIPMQLPCCALIAGDHLNADAITAAIISSDQGMPARLFLIVHFLSMHLFDCCVSSAVAHSPLSYRAAVVHRDRAAIVHRDRAAAVHLASTATTTGDHQYATVALLSLFQEGTADDELIVGLDSLSIGDADDNSMEDPFSDGDATDGHAPDGHAPDGDMEDGEAAMNGLRQMGQRLRFDILNRFLMISPATSSGEGKTMMKRPCLTSPVLRKGAPMNRAWRPDRKRRRKKKSKEAIITTSSITWCEYL